jgi:HK97 family phage major capsid protein
MTIQELQARQKAIFERQTALSERTLSEAEEAEFTALENEFEQNKKELQRRETLRNRAASFAAAGVQNAEEKEFNAAKKRFSITKALRSQLKNGKLDGVEKEFHEEAENEARGFGGSISGVGIPSSMFRPAEKRDLTVGTGTQIGYTVATNVGEMIPYLQPRLQTAALGATVLSGLTSNLDLPVNDAIAAATWEGETDANAETNPTVARIQLTPKRLGAFIDYSKQLLVQSSVGVDSFVQSQLTSAIQIALDAAAINGSGSGGQPTGILNTSGIGNVAMGTNGAVPTYAKLVDTITEVAVDNADFGNLAWLTTPGVRGVLQKTTLDTGSGLFVWERLMQNNLLGYRAEVSTNVPSTLTKGSSSNCHAIIFGNWQELLIAQWGGLDLLVDPYTQGTQSLIRVVANSWWDIALRHAASFAAIKDATLA